MLYFGEHFLYRNDPYILTKERSSVTLETYGEYPYKEDDDGNSAAGYQTR